MATDGKEDETMYQNEAIGYSLVSIPPSNLDQNPKKRLFNHVFKRLCFGVNFLGYGTNMPIYSFSLLQFNEKFLIEFGPQTLFCS